MAKLNLSEHRLPQEGRIWFTQAEKPLDLRLSILPTPHGEHVVLRLLEPSQVPPLKELGWSEAQLALMQGLLARPSGLLLVSGPAGAGLSTTLYAALAGLNTERSRIVTVEDPIEQELPRVTQVQVQPKIGLTYAAGLRAALQHDPNIILIGELRDQDTAQLAVRAALSGHLVLGAMHTLDAASSITRLLDFGIEPFLLCSTVLGIASQRLVRVLCRECRHAMQVDPATLATMGIAAAGAGPIKMWRARTCPACRESGYHGRTGVFEVLPVDHHVRSLMIKRASGLQIRQSAMAQGMQTLWQSGWQKMLSGVTSLEELARVVPRELR
jgi:type II secretory ATPase GspE/PulE/Tfp pilus assembly ATPase PilB-like protein